MSSPGDERDSDGDGGRSGSEVESGRGTRTGPDGRESTHSEPPPRQREPADDRAVPPAREEWRRDGEAPYPAAGEESADGTSGWRVFAYDVASSVLAVLVVGAYLFAVSGVWPPLVAVESRSMAPNMQVNDLVFVMEADRFPGPNAHDTSGVVPASAGASTDYRKFGGYGDVVVYERDGDGERVPIIHRAMLWVEEDENWYDRANPEFVGGASECGDSPEEGLRNCPAPHSGFITKGDNNNRYDQASGLSEPVRPTWIVGTAEVRIPGLGWIRLQSQAGAENVTGPGAVPVSAG
jgi:signal peptidase